MASTRSPAASLAVFVACLLVYAPTLYPTVPGGDAGELVVVAQAFAVAHPPGYPLWTMLAGLFAMLPAGSVAWRVAWLSAICSSAAASLIFATVRSACSSEGRGVANAAGVLAAFLFAFSPLVWTYSIGAEVFPLHCFFVALLCWLALRWHRSHETRTAIAIAFTSGLGLSNHHTLILHAAAILAFVLWTGRGQLLALRPLAMMTAAGTAGLLPYAYLWLGGLRDHPLSWGETTTVDGFLDHLLRRDYGTFHLLPVVDEPEASLALKLATYARHALGATLGTVLVLLPAAFVRPRAAEEGPPLRPWLLLMAACSLAYLLVFHWRANVPVQNPLLLGVLSRFWMQADVVVCVLVGVGFARGASRLRMRAPMAWTAAALLVALRIGTSAGEHASRGDGIVEGYARAILTPLPHNALLLTRGDLVTNGVRYLQACEHLREDVVVLDQELLTKPWYLRRMQRVHPDVRFPGTLYHPGVDGGFLMRELLDANHGGRPLFVYPDWKSGDPSIAGNYRAWPNGLAMKIEPADSPPPIQKWLRESSDALAAIARPGWPSIESRARGSWERVALEDIWQAAHRHAVVVLEEAIRAGDRGLLTIARGELEAARLRHPDPPWQLWKNLGLVYGHLHAAGDPGSRVQQLDAWRRYLAGAPAGDPDRAKIEQIVAQLTAKGS